MGGVTPLSRTIDQREHYLRKTLARMMDEATGVSANLETLRAQIAALNDELAELEVARGTLGFVKGEVKDG